jgi:hypothetical protein
MWQYIWDITEANDAIADGTKNWGRRILKEGIKQNKIRKINYYRYHISFRVKTLGRL